MQTVNSSALPPEVRRAMAAIAAVAGVDVVLSTALPSNPAVGAAVLESDTSVFRVWDGTTWVAPVAVWA